MQHRPKARWPVGDRAVVKSAGHIVTMLDMRGLDCAALAREINAKQRADVVSRQFLSRLKTGKTRSCTVELAARIARELGVDIALLFDVVTLPKSPRRRAQKTARGSGMTRGTSVAA